MALILYMFLMVAMIFLLVAYGFDMFRFENGLFSAGMYFKWSAMYSVAMPTFLVVGWVLPIINFIRAKNSLRHKACFFGLCARATKQPLAVRDESDGIKIGRISKISFEMEPEPEPGPEPEPEPGSAAGFAFAPPRTTSGAEAMKTAVRHTLVPLWPCCRRGAWMRVTRYDRS